MQNVDGIPQHEDGNIKLDCLYQFTQDYQADIVALTERNMAWDKWPYEERLPYKTRGWWEASHWSVSHNKKDKHGDGFQPGGMAILVLNKWAHWAMRPGDNTTGLGCWSWVQLRGRENHHLRIVAVYHPCKANGHLMTYQQQIRGQPVHKPFMCPWKKLLQDLQEQIIAWRSEGDQVIILADMNDDVWKDLIQALATQMGLQEAVTAQHGPGKPNTHNRGSTPIDRIFIPAAYIPAIQLGYLAFNEGILSNHRAVWVDIPLNILGWLQASECIPLQAC